MAWRVCKGASVSSGVPTKVIAAIGGLAAFAIALVAGLAADNPADVVLFRALVALLVCNVVGWFIGLIGERTIREALDQHARSNPIPAEASPELAPASKSSEAVLDV